MILSRRSFLASVAAVGAVRPSLLAQADMRADFAKSVKHVAVNGTDIAYLEKGSGKPVVLVHDALADLRIWDPVVETLAARNRVIAYSLRGHFPNTWNVDDPEYTTDLHATDLMALLKTIKAGRVSFVGHGLGGRIAAIVAAQRSDMVRGVVLAEPTIASLLVDSPLLDEADKQSIALDSSVMQAMMKADVSAACRAFVDAQCGVGAYDALDASWKRQLADNVSTLMPMLAYTKRGEFRCEDVKRITSPTLVLYGESTLERWQAVASKLSECLPTDVVAKIPGAGHRVNTDNPGAFGRSVAEFLATV